MFPKLPFLLFSSSSSSSNFFSHFTFTFSTPPISGAFQVDCTNHLVQIYLSTSPVFEREKKESFKFHNDLGSHNSKVFNCQKCHQCSLLVGGRKNLYKICAEYFIVFSKTPITLPHRLQLQSVDVGEFSLWLDLSMSDLLWPSPQT